MKKINICENLKNYLDNLGCYYKIAIVTRRTFVIQQLGHSRTQNKLGF